MRALILAGTIVALSGCASELWLQPGAAIDKWNLPSGQTAHATTAGLALHAGVRDYEEGRLPESEKQLRAALREGLNRAQRIQAHKHLAFIYCSSNRKPDCREQFKKALSIDPSVELEHGEAGHPTWDPVFRSVKGSGSARM